MGTYYCKMLHFLMSAFISGSHRDSRINSKSLYLSPQSYEATIADINAQRTNMFSNYLHIKLIIPVISMYLWICTLLKVDYVYATENAVGKSCKLVPNFSKCPFWKSCKISGGQWKRTIVQVTHRLSVHYANTCVILYVCTYRIHIQLQFIHTGFSGYLSVIVTVS